MTALRPANVKPFAQRLEEAIDAKGSCLVVGLDPILERLPPDSLAAIGHRASGSEGETARAAASFGLFCRVVIEQVADVAVAVKPNIAFFERYGAAGLDVLRSISKEAQDAGLLVILDAKRGDIGHTAEAYAEALLGTTNDTLGPHVDALTLNPYLGRDSITPFVDRAQALGRGLFLLVRTSNRSAADFQELEVAGAPLYVEVARQVAAWATECREKDGWSCIGAVVGATSPEAAAQIREILTASYFLVPGVGAQGGDPKDLAPYFVAGGHGAIINASRSIIFAYESRPGPWPDAIRAAAQETRDTLEMVRTGR